MYVVCMYLCLLSYFSPKPFVKCKYVSLNNCIQINRCSFPEMVHSRPIWIMRLLRDEMMQLL